MFCFHFCMVRPKDLEYSFLADHDFKMYVLHITLMFISKFLFQYPYDCI